VWTRLLSVISISESDKELRDDIGSPGWTAGITIHWVTIKCHWQWFRTVEWILNINTKWSAIGIPSTLRWIKPNCSCSRICSFQSIISSSRTCVEGFHRLMLLEVGSVMVWERHRQAAHWHVAFVLSLFCSQPFCLVNCTFRYSAKTFPFALSDLAFGLFFLDLF
jgi:hypothetical protein